MNLVIESQSHSRKLGGNYISFMTKKILGSLNISMKQTHVEYIDTWLRPRI